MIQNSCIEFWLDVGSAVGDGGVSGGQLQVGDTVGETSECQCLVAALVDADGGKTKVADVIVTQGMTICASVLTATTLMESMIPSRSVVKPR